MEYRILFFLALAIIGIYGIEEPKIEEEESVFVLTKVFCLLSLKD